MQFFIGRIRHRRRGERAREHLAFERDVDYARTFGEESAECGKHERSRQPDGRSDQRKCEDVSHLVALTRRSGLILIASHLKNDSAATKRMMIPCKTCTMSFVTCSEKPST